MAQGPELIVFTRTGTYRSLSPDFDARLTDDYAADLIIPADFRSTLASTRAGRRLNPRFIRHEANRRVDQAVAESLDRGHNVVLGGFLNVKSRRENIKSVAAEVSGARVVSLAVRTTPEVIRERIEDRLKREVNDELILPDNAPVTVEKNVEVARDIESRIEWPDPLHEAHLSLDGSLETTELLIQIANYLGW